MTAQNLATLKEIAQWHDGWASRYNEAIVRAHDPVDRVGYEGMRNTHQQLAAKLATIVRDTEPELKLEEPQAK